MTNHFTPVVDVTRYMNFVLFVSKNIVQKLLNEKLKYFFLFLLMIEPEYYLLEKNV